MLQWAWPCGIAFSLKLPAFAGKISMKTTRKIKILILGLLLGLPAAPATRADTFIVTTTNDTGAGSLRAAITSANGMPGGTNTIQFAITDPPAGVRTITPASLLPFITAPVILEGYTQADSSPN